MTKRLPTLFCCWLALSAAARAQDDFELDDSLFGDEFLEAGESSYGSAETWYDPFTAKISYQSISQINEHENELSFETGTEVEKPYIENNRLSLLLKYQNAFAPGWLLQGNGHAKVYGRRDYEYRANNDNVETEYRVNELFIQRSFEDHSVKFGRQTLVWGEAEGNSVLDVINTTERRDLGIIDIEDARLNQWMLLWNYYQDRSRFSTFVNLYPEFNPLPDRGSPFYQNIGYDLPDDPDRDSALYEAGMQWRHSVPGSDISVMAAYLYENQLRYTLAPDPTPAVHAWENDYWLLGFSANRAIGRLLLKGDVAYSRGIIADTVAWFPGALPGGGAAMQPGYIEKDKLGTTLGFEYGISADQQLMLLARAETFLDRSAGLADNESLLNDEVFGTYLLRYSHNLQQYDLALSSTIQRELDGSSILVALGFNYALDDNWSAFTQFIWTDADADHPAVFLDDDLRFEFTISFAF